MPYGSFGNIVFEVVEYFEHTEENEYIYARKNTIYPPSTTQYLGKELRKLKMTIKLHHMISKPEETYKKLKELAEKGEAHKLIIAEQVLGNFVIDKISASYKQVSRKGIPIAIVLEIELNEYVKKELQTVKNKQALQKPKKTTHKTPSKYKAIITKDKEGNTQVKKG